MPVPDVADIVLQLVVVSQLHGLLGARAEKQKTLKRAVELAVTMSDTAGNVRVAKAAVDSIVSHLEDDPALARKFASQLKSFKQRQPQLAEAEMKVVEEEAQIMFGQRCSNPECDKLETEEQKFKKCGNCKTVAYCGVTCA